MRKQWMVRKDQEGVSPVIATILMVAITVVLAAVLYAMIGMFMQNPPSQSHMVVFTKQNASDNWALLVSKVQGDIPLSSATLTIKNENANVMYPMSAIPLSELTSDNWETYKVLYQKVKTTDENIVAGASILVDMDAYPSGCSYLLVDSTGIIATGAL